MHMSKLEEDTSELDLKSHIVKHMVKQISQTHLRLDKMLQS